MYEVRVHGRGGQGAVTAAELLPVAAFCRIDDRVIRLREPVLEPDAECPCDAIDMLSQTT